MQILYLLLWLSIFAQLARGSFFNPPKPAILNSTEAVHAQSRILESHIRNGVDKIIKFVLPVIIRANSELDISDDCSDAILKLVLGIRKFKTWAFSMLDASGKLPSGIFSGTNSELGAYDQCLNIEVPDNDEYSDDKVLFRGQYCTLQLLPYLPPKPKIYKLNNRLKVYENYSTDVEMMEELTKYTHTGYFLGIRIGICLPSACTLRDVQEMTKLMDIGFQASVPTCEKKEEFVFSALQIVMLAIFSLLGLLVAIGTTVEVISKIIFEDTQEKYSRYPPILFDILTSFSVYSNTKNLFKNENKGNLSSLHGVKFFSLTWVIIAHTYILWDLHFARMIFSIAITEIPKFLFQAVANASISIDTFFFITGVLLSYLTLTTIEKHGKESFNIPIYFFHRFWRLFPPTVGIIGLTFLLPLMGSGPNWHDTIDVVVNNCRKNWWTNLIFVNNFLDHKDVCLFYTWYTAADFQMYILALGFFLLLFRKDYYGHLYLILLAVLSIVSLAVINIWLDLPPTILPSEPDPDNQLRVSNYLHFKPNSHLAPYAIGMWLGYILVKYSTVQIHPILQVIGWALATVCNVTVLYSTYLWNDKVKATMAESAIYCCLHGTGWSLGLAWMIYMCATQRGGIINTILSWSALVPLSRLTFFAYLLHCHVIWIFVGNLRGPIDAHQLFAVWIIVGNIVASYCFAYVGFILLEAPMSRLYKLFMSKLLKKNDQERKITEMWNTKTKKEKILTLDKDGSAVYRL